MIGDGVIHLFALATVSNEAGRAEHTEVVGDRRDRILRPNRQGKLADIQVAVRKQMQQGNSRWIAEGLEDTGKATRTVVVSQRAAVNLGMSRHARSHAISWPNVTGPDV